MSDPKDDLVLALLEPGVTVLDADGVARVRALCGDPIDSNIGAISAALTEAALNAMAEMVAMGGGKPDAIHWPDATPEQRDALEANGVRMLDAPAEAPTPCHCGTALDGGSGDSACSCNCPHAGDCFAGCTCACGWDQPIDPRVAEILARGGTFNESMKAMYPDVIHAPAEFALLGSVTFPSGVAEGPPLGVVTDVDREAGVVTVGGGDARFTDDGVAALHAANGAVTMGPMPVEPVAMVGLAALLDSEETNERVTDRRGGLAGWLPPEVDRRALMKAYGFPDPGAAPPLVTAEPCPDGIGHVITFLAGQQWRAQAMLASLGYRDLANTLPAGLARWEAQAAAKALREFAEGA